MDLQYGKEMDYIASIFRNSLSSAKHAPVRFIYFHLHELKKHINSPAGIINLLQRSNTS
jgi:hypothetical protein